MRAGPDAGLALPALPAVPAVPDPIADVPLAEIHLSGLRARGHHGVFESERTDGQDFVVDVTLRLDTDLLAVAARTDDLAATVDYGGLAARVEAVVAGPPVALLETLSWRIAQLCLADPRVSSVAVTVHKPHAPVPVPVEDVAVQVRLPRTAPSGRAVLSLGSNLGDRGEALQGAVDALAASPGLRVTAASPVYETAPVLGDAGAEQPDYLNAVVLVEASLTAPALLARAHDIEAAYGRERGPTTPRWGPRRLDIDLVVADLPAGPAVASDGLVAAMPTLPHPRAHQRAFVLAPWCDVDPHAALPGFGPVERLLVWLLGGRPAAEAGVRRRPDITLRPA